MRKKILISVACVATITLFFVCQKQSSLNSYIVSNVEALTSGDPGGGTNVSIETTAVYKIVTNPKSPAYYTPFDDYPIQGTQFSGEDHSIYDWIIYFLFGGFSGDYWCSIESMQVWTPFICYEIVVSGN